ncbi:MAG: hypothetical protein ABI467_15440 [Kofleriaceae bacterium]
MGEASLGGPGLGGSDPNGPGIGAASPSGPAIGEQAPSPPPAAPPSNQALPVPGVPTSISFEIVAGTAQDAVHAMYKSGSSVQLRAIIRDGYGNIISPTKDHPCTPEFALEGTGTPSGGSRATLLPGGVVNFKEPGPFTVSVACREHPEINSHGNTSPYNFETNDTSPFTHEAHVAQVAAHPAGLSPAEVLLIVAAGVGLAYVIVDETTSAGSGGSGDCGCVCAYGGNDCSNGGTAFCTADYGFAVGCASSTGNCDCSNGATARVAAPRTVEQVVARGLRQRPVPPVRTVAAHVATELRGAHPRAIGATGTTTPSTSHLGAWVGGSLAAVSVASTVYLLWARAHPHRLDLVPYAAPNGGGVAVLGRF